MISLKRVLVPTDFSETANAALKYGVELARTFGATLHVLHVITAPRNESWMGYAPGWEFMKTIEHLRSDALRQMQELLAAERVEPIRVVLDVVHGEAAEVALQYATEHAIGLIVCGTHGRRGLNRLVMGSVAEVIVRKAPCPVLTVQHPEREFVVAEKDPSDDSQPTVPLEPDQSDARRNLAADESADSDGSALT
jgi:nucleotide-binding universal stress UspA family protein